MDQQELPQQTEMVDIYDFPADLINYPLIAWMGDNYIRFIAVELLRRFQQQDAGAKLLAMKCESPPKFASRANEQTGAITQVVVDFDLQLLLKSSDGKSWRLRGISRFAAHALDQTQYPPIQVAFEMSSKEEVV
jgi:hypothetical protein